MFASPYGFQWVKYGFIDNEERFLLVNLIYYTVKVKIMDDEESTPSFLVQRRSKKNRQTKTQLVFDEQARK